MPSYKKIINELIKRNISISVAESCSGGQLSSTITKVPGVSKIFNMGIVTYSNQAKSSLLKIPISKIIKHGTVSKEVALSMVLKLAKLSKSKICISTTGISGPSGGTKNKPIGLVYIGVKFNKQVFVVKNIFIGDRKKIQHDTVNYALQTIGELI
tara:strand:- start:56 stop:520 length:465 start_codon:yes stop_codon:yes gene_type:complete